MLAEQGAFGIPTPPRNLVGPLGVEPSTNGS